MLKKTITYPDYVGREWTEDFYFSLTKTELTEMEVSAEGGMLNLMNNIVKAVDRKKLYYLIKEIIVKSYGEKSSDGKRFVKSKEMAEAFTQTAAYDVLFMELVNDDVKAAEFITGILPSDLAAKVTETDLKESNPLDALPTKVTEATEVSNE